MGKTLRMLVQKWRDEKGWMIQS
jgi:hypothetical protein